MLKKTGYGAHFVPIIFLWDLQLARKGCGFLAITSCVNVTRPICDGLKVFGSMYHYKVYIIVEIQLWQFC